MRNMRRSSTLSSYSLAYKRFEAWSSKFSELTSYPTDEHAIGLYIMTLVQNGKSISTIRQFIASVTWLHDLGGYEDPSKSQLVKSILESAYRQSVKPVIHKVPVTKQILQDIHDVLFGGQSSFKLTDVRDFCYILLSFTGFMRFDEASSIRRQHLHLFFDYMLLDIPQSKCNKSGEPEHIYIARTSSDLCTLTWVARYLKMANIQDDCTKLIFRGIIGTNKASGHSLRPSDKKLSHTTLSEIFKKRLEQCGHAEEGLSLHSLRAGGVTLAAASGVAEGLYKSHSRWKSSAVQDYVTENVQEKLRVTRSMDL